jgi:hypothetical protein
LTRSIQLGSLPVLRVVDQLAAEERVDTATMLRIHDAAHWLPLRLERFRTLISAVGPT